MLSDKLGYIIHGVCDILFITNIWIQILTSHTISRRPNIKLVRYENKHQTNIKKFILKKISFGVYFDQG